MHIILKNRWLIHRREIPAFRQTIPIQSPPPAHAPIPLMRFALASHQWFMADRAHGGVGAAAAMRSHVPPGKDIEERCFATGAVAAIYTLIRNTWITGEFGRARTATPVSSGSSFRHHRAASFLSLKLMISCGLYPRLSHSAIRSRSGVVASETREREQS